MSRPYMPLYVADYLSATTHLDAAQSGAYLHLLMHYWQKGSLPHEDQFLARIARMSRKQWLSAKPTIRAFFNEDWTHDRADAEIDKANAKAEARSAFGKMGGDAKALKSKEAALAKATVLQDETPSKTPSKPLPSSSGLGLEEGKKERNAREACLAVGSFERFWNAYPEKVGKKPAALAFLKVASEIDVILEGLSRYILAKPPDRSWLNPATFINQRRWEDQPAPNSGVQNGQRIGSGKGSLVEAGQRLIRELDERAEQSMRSEGFGPSRDNDAVLLPFFGGQRS